MHKWIIPGFGFGFGYGLLHALLLVHFDASDTWFDRAAFTVLAPLLGGLFGAAIGFIIAFCSASYRRLRQGRSRVV